MSIVVLCPNERCRRQWEVETSGNEERCPHCGLALRLSWESAAKALAGKPAVTTTPEAGAASRPVPLDEHTPLPDVGPETLNLPKAARSPVEETASSGLLPAVPGLQRLGRFFLKRLLAEGAFGLVYEAYDPQLERPIAIKVAKVEKMDSPERLRRFLREARAAANLRHPNIVPVYDAGQEGECFYFASAIIGGQTLGELMQTERLSLQRSATLMRELAEGLAYAHERGVVHRDVKPGNVLIDEAGHAVLADFGLAFRREEGRLTRVGALLGTPQFMAPEQIRGESDAVLPASDQYSLGIILYELLTGQAPFVGELETLLFQHLQNRPKPPSRLNPQIPRELEIICLRCLEKEPDRRFASCAELAQALASWLEREQTPARPKAREARRKRETAPPTRPAADSSYSFLRETVIWAVLLITSALVVSLILTSLMGQR